MDIDEIILVEIDKSAKRIARDWPGIDAEDIAQEMVLKVCENWDASLKDQDGPTRRRMALGLAELRGKQYAAGERYEYQQSTSEWIYTPQEVRGLLAEYFLIDGWEDAPRRPNRTETVAADGVSVALMDIRKAYEAAPERDQTLIMRAYQSHESLPDTDYRALRRAVDRLAQALNRKVTEAQAFAAAVHDGPGSRKAVSNAHARTITGNNY